MLASMTGYGKSVCQYKNKIIKLEIRTLNSKNIDLAIKMPGYYREKENVIRSMLSKAFERGKIELIMTLECAQDQMAYHINKPILLHYFKEMQDVGKALDTPVSSDILAELLRLPDVMQTQSEELVEEEWNEIASALKEAISHVQRYRESEGKHMYEDIVSREKNIRNLLQRIEPFESKRIENTRERIMRSLKDIKESINVDQNRFEQEVIFYLEKLDITEEQVRLQKHLDYFHETLDGNGALGKKLGFIAQEVGREINTIGSKANDAEMQKVVVQMKDELEKIKEQLMNVL